MPVDPGEHTARLSPDGRFVFATRFDPFGWAYRSLTKIPKTKSELIFGRANLRQLAEFSLIVGNLQSEGSVRKADPEAAVGSQAHPFEEGVSILVEMLCVVIDSRFQGIVE